MEVLLLVLSNVIEKRQVNSSSGGIQAAHHFQKPDEDASFNTNK